MSDTFIHETFRNFDPMISFTYLSSDIKTIIGFRKIVK